ncbi:MAG TPA: hypothetical protein PKB03_02730, partial [Baekduia sp.]|nr:hypothetical protein [Baekduia sp.]
MSLSARMLSFPAGRRSKWVVLLAWVLVIGVVLTLQLPTKFQDAEKNETSSFLPSGTESTQVLEKVKRMQGDEYIPAVVVSRREGGLTAADKAQIAKNRERLNEVKASGVQPFGM